MKTIKEYVDNFLRLYNEKIEKVTTEYKKDGEDISDINTIQTIKEESYYYFESDEYYDMVDKDTWAEVQAGKTLLENRSPKIALKTYTDECIEDIPLPDEQKVIDILKALCDSQ